MKHVLRFIMFASFSACVVLLLRNLLGDEVSWGWVAGSFALAAVCAIAGTTKWKETDPYAILEGYRPAQNAAEEPARDTSSVKRSDSSGANPFNKMGAAVSPALGTWVREYKALTWLLISILVCLYAWVNREDDWGWLFVFGLISAFLAAVTMAGKLPDLMAAVGRGIGWSVARWFETLFFMREKARYTAGFLAWGTSLLLAGAVLIAAQMLDLDWLESAYEIQTLGFSLGSWMIAVGFFLLIFMTLAGTKFDIESGRG